MPTYVYECRNCHKVFEVDQRITADALTDCDACGTKGSLRRLIQPVGVSFKGAGFHINDYAPKASDATSPAAETAPAVPAASTPKEAGAGSQEPGGTSSKPESGTKPADSPTTAVSPPSNS